MQSYSFYTAIYVYILEKKRRSCAFKTLINDVYRLRRERIIIATDAHTDPDEIPLFRASLLGPLTPGLPFFMDELAITRSIRTSAAGVIIGRHSLRNQRNGDRAAAAAS